MRQIVNINENWLFVKKDLKPEDAETAEGEKINVPFTWNNIDGQDGGNDYVRAAYVFVKKFTQKERVYIEFKGVNSSAVVWVNGINKAEHDGGYSTFRTDITDCLKDENTLVVRVDNSKTEKVYPQTADFTFYGGIYRDVNLITVSENHFDLDFYGSPGVKIDAAVNGKDGQVTVTDYVTGRGRVEIEILDADGKCVGRG